MLLKLTYMKHRVDGGGAWQKEFVGYVAHSFDDAKWTVELALQLDVGAQTEGIETVWLHLQVHHVAHFQGSF